LNINLNINNEIWVYKRGSMCVWRGRTNRKGEGE
jgi:hypothetical protein